MSSLIEPQSSSEDPDFGPEDFADNPEPRCPCALVLDTSDSMGKKITVEGVSTSLIAELNKGIKQFEHDIKNDDLAAKRVEVAIIGFGGHAKPIEFFKTVDEFDAPTLTTNGNTPMGDALEKTIELVKLRKQVYQENYIKSYVPWIILITDGHPTDSIAKAKELIANGEKNNEFIFLAIGVQGANMTKLSELSTKNGPHKLAGIKFNELFKWISASMIKHSSEDPGNNGSGANVPQISWAVDNA